jgi:hypothetical protein
MEEPKFIICAVLTEGSKKNQRIEKTDHPYHQPGKHLAVKKA